MRMRMRTTSPVCWLLAPLLWLSACGSQPDSGQPASPTAAAPLPAASPTATPTAAPNPEPTPVSPAANRPPTVTLQGGGGCHPAIPWAGHVEPCTVRFEAKAHDPDGDRLTYEWSGCASGSDTRAECQVSAPGKVQAWVQVSDGRGGSARAKGTAEGTNEPPVARFGEYAPSSLAPGQEGQFLGWIEDEDVNCGRPWCRGARVSGACVGEPRLECTCLAGLELYARAGASPGTCHIEIELVDPWGRAGVTRLDVPVR